MVDALASGASDRKVVEVRVFSWAPFMPFKIQQVIEIYAIIVCIDFSGVQIAQQKRGPISAMP